MFSHHHFLSSPPFITTVQTKWSQVFSFTYCCYDKTFTKANSWRKEFISLYNSRWQSITWRSGRNLRQEPEDRNWCGETGSPFPSSSARWWDFMHGQVSCTLSQSLWQLPCSVWKTVSFKLSITIGSYNLPVPLFWEELWALEKGDNMCPISGWAPSLRADQPKVSMLIAIYCKKLLEDCWKIHW